MHQYLALAFSVGLLSALLMAGGVVQLHSTDEIARGWARTFLSAGAFFFMIFAGMLLGYVIAK